jgi:ferrous iron transport protein A
LLPLRLDQLPFNAPAAITTIDWAALSEKDARRLRELGFDEGMQVEALHCGFLGRDPIACRIGRMTVAIRRAHAAAMMVVQQ